MAKSGNPPSVHALTAVLRRVNAGDDRAFAELVERVYADLRRLADARMKEAFKRPLEALTLSPSAIVNDAVMQLMRQRAEWKNTEQFFAIATRLMMRVITDYQRERMAQKRGGGRRGARLDTVVSTKPEASILPDEDGHAAILEAVERLHERQPRAAEVAVLHVICNLSIPKVAELIGVSVPTATRDWRFARTWLQAELGESAL